MTVCNTWQLSGGIRLSSSDDLLQGQHGMLGAPSSSGGPNDLGTVLMNNVFRYGRLPTWTPLSPGLVRSHMGPQKLRNCQGAGTFSLPIPQSHRLKKGQRFGLSALLAVIPESIMSSLLQTVSFD